MRLACPGLFMQGGPKPDELWSHQVLRYRQRRGREDVPVRIGLPRPLPGIFNGEAQDFSYGLPFTRETADEIVESLRPSYVRGLSLLGGDPMEPEHQSELLALCELVIRELPEKDVWCYTGYVYDRDLVPGGRRYVEGVTDALFDCIDVLVDGPFIEAEKDITLRFRGSANQRLIDLPKTRETGQICLWSDGPVFGTHAM